MSAENESHAGIKQIYEHIDIIIYNAKYIYNDLQY